MSNLHKPQHATGKKRSTTEKRDKRAAESLKMESILDANPNFNAIKSLLCRVDYTDAFRRIDYSVVDAALFCSFEDVQRQTIRACWSIQDTIRDLIQDNFYAWMKEDLQRIEVGLWTLLNEGRCLSETNLSMTIEYLGMLHYLERSDQKKLTKERLLSWLIASLKSVCADSNHLQLEFKLKRTLPAQEGEHRGLGRNFDKISRSESLVAMIRMLVTATTPEEYEIFLKFHPDIYDTIWHLLHVTSHNNTIVECIVFLAVQSEWEISSNFHLNSERKEILREKLRKVSTANHHPKKKINIAVLEWIA
eukprot:TRINITY_DN5366_c0_g1_i1.p1 TRINITY_DN5366_c0_g1~~TRINITY_DN5366_c0_g1_i1.p1  ORF type:complete len:306 (-),score=74.01 TRINITY_DN5366_c0_g1_i1:447-1364(-)